jgi:hypothetical protein
MPHPLALGPATQQEAGAPQASQVPPGVQPVYGPDMLINPCPAGYVLHQVDGAWMCVLEDAKAGLMPGEDPRNSLTLGHGGGPGGPGKPSNLYMTSHPNVGHQNIGTPV